MGSRGRHNRFGSFGGPFVFYSPKGHMFLLALLWLSSTPVPPAAQSPNAAENVPRAVFSESLFNFGKVMSGIVVEHDFIVKNEGSVPLRIRRASMTPPLLVTRMPREVAPGTEGVIHFKLDTSKVEGPFQGAIVVFLDDPALPEADLSFKGQVAAPIELAPLPAFFVSALRGETRQSSIEIINHEPEPLLIQGIEHSSERFTTKLETIEEGQHYRLTLILRPDGPGGRSTEAILLKTSSQKMPVVRVAANTYLHERVYTFPDQIDMGTLRIGDVQRHPELLQTAAQTLMIYQEGGSDFQVSIKTDLPDLDLKLERGRKGDRYQVTIRLLPEKLPTGPIRGSIFIETNDRDFQKLTVPVSGNLEER